MDLLASAMPNESQHQQQHAGERNNHARKMGPMHTDDTTIRTKKTAGTSAGPDLNQHRDHHAHGRRASGHSMHAWKRMHGQRRYSHNISGPRRVFGETRVSKRMYEPYMRHVYTRGPGNTRFGIHGETRVQCIHAFRGARRSLHQPPS